MIDMNELEAEIRRLESGNTTYGVIDKLSMLYTVRDHLSPSREYVEQQSYSYSSESKSEFIEAITGADMNRVLDILDEHMSAVRVLYPKEYSLVIEKIRQTKGE